jgi:MscS family membrane protein
MAKDGGLDEEKSRRAAEAVGKWRDEGGLPFPDHRRVRISQLEGTLEFPPEGSVLREKKEID